MPQSGRKGISWGWVKRKCDGNIFKISNRLRCFCKAYVAETDKIKIIIKTHFKQQKHGKDDTKYKLLHRMLIMYKVHD